MTTHVEAHDALIAHIETILQAGYPTLAVYYENTLEIDLNTAPSMFLRVNLELSATNLITTDNTFLDRSFGEIVFSLSVKDGTGTRFILDIFDYLTRETRHENLSGVILGSASNGPKSVQPGWKTYTLLIPYYYDSEMSIGDPPSDLTYEDVVTALGFTPVPANHLHVIGDVENLQTALNGKETQGTASSLMGNHTAGTGVHSIAGVTGLQSALDGKEASGTTATHAAGTGVHSIAGVTGLQTALDGKEASGTTATHAAGTGVHSIAGVTGLQTALDSKETAGASATRSPMSGFPVDSSGAYYVSLSYNETTRTITVTPLAATFDVFVNGTKYTFTGAQSIQHGATKGGHFVYVNNSGAIVTGQTPWDLAQTAPIAYIFWDATNSIGWPFFELHHAGRDVWMHKRLHDIDGTQAGSGFSLSGYTLNDGSADSAVTVAVSTGTVIDEDIQITTQSLADGDPYWILERSGASGDWIITRTSVLPFLYSGSNLQYNQNTGATWQRTNVPEDNFVNYWLMVVPALPTTAISPTPSSTPQFAIIAGQTVHSSQALATAESISALSWGSAPFQEMASLYQITLRYNASAPAAYANTARCAIVAVTRIVGSRASIAAAAQTDHGGLAGLHDFGDHNAEDIAVTPSGNLAATNIQAALSELQTDIDGRATIADALAFSIALGG